MSRIINAAKLAIARDSDNADDPPVSGLIMSAINKAPANTVPAASNPNVDRRQNRAALGRSSQPDITKAIFVAVIPAMRVYATTLNGGGY